MTSTTASAPARVSRFELGDHAFGVLICYEDTDLTLARQYVAPGTRLVTSS
jgi:apolipoprotein N-acyltransferase